MNFLRISSKLSRLSYSSLRNFASGESSSMTTTIGGVKRNTKSDAGTGFPPREAYKHLKEEDTRGAGGGNSRGETVTNRNTVLDTEHGKVSPHNKD